MFYERDSIYLYIVDFGSEFNGLVSLPLMMGRR